MIGEKDAWGKGYATETARLMLDYGFHALNLHNIMLTVYRHQSRRRRSPTSAPGSATSASGARPGGSAGEAIDVIIMECLATEFTGSVLLRGCWRGRRRTPARRTG